MKINPNNIDPPSKFMFEEYVYSKATYDPTFKDFIYGNNIIARKKIIPLTKKSDLVFYNSELSKAIKPRNDKTAITIFNNNDVEINGTSFELDRGNSAIVFNRVPPIGVSKCEVVIYEGLTAENIIYSDGSTQMDEDYKPTANQDVITKKFLDNTLSGVRSSFYTLNNLDIKQGGKDLPVLVKHSDNKRLPVIFIDNSSEELTISTNPFIINNEFNIEETYIQLNLGNRVFYKTLLKDIISGLNTSNWNLSESSNPYELNDHTMYLLNTYTLTISNFNIISFLLRDLDINPEVVLSIEVCCGTKKIETAVLVGIDYSSHSLIQTDITWDPLELLNLKTKVISGVHYFDSPTDKYPLNVNFIFNNAYLNLYRPISFIEVGVYDKSSNIRVDYKFGLYTHIPRIVANQFISISKEIQLSADISKIFIRVYDNYSNLIVEQTKEISCNYLDDDESLRLFTPDATVVNVNPNILTEWDSSKTLEEYEPSLISKGEYKLLNPLFKDYSSLAFQVIPKNHYSGILLDIDHDGEMEIMSLGNTAWLDCESTLDLFKNPVNYKDPCKVPDSNLYSFGRTLYDNPILVRINKATHIKINKVDLG